MPNGGGRCEEQYFAAFGGERGSHGGFQTENGDIRVLCPQERSGDGGRGVACDDDDAAPRAEQSGYAAIGGGDYLFVALFAVRSVGRVVHIDVRRAGQQPLARSHDGQPAHPAVEKTYAHTYYICAG